MEPYRLFDLSGLGTVSGGLVGVLLYEFGIFVWHYCLHRYHFLWRTFHQMHHSAERIDTLWRILFQSIRHDRLDDEGYRKITNS